MVSLATVKATAGLPTPLPLLMCQMEPTGLITAQVAVLQPCDPLCRNLVLSAYGPTGGGTSHSKPGTGIRVMAGLTTVETTSGVRTALPLPWRDAKLAGLVTVQMMAGVRTLLPLFRGAVNTAQQHGLRVCKRQFALWPLLLQ